MENKKKGLDLLREPFPENLISQLPKPTCGADEYKKLPKGKCDICGGWHATSKTIHLSYVGHAALTDRLLDCDPNWSWEPYAHDELGLPLFDKTGGLWIKLTVCGITRPGYGHAKENKFAEIGSREKEVIGDALRNAAMRFGAALDLWHKGDLHQEDDNFETDPKNTEKQQKASNQEKPKDVKIWLQLLESSFKKDPENLESWWPANGDSVKADCKEKAAEVYNRWVEIKNNCLF